MAIYNSIASSGAKSVLWKVSVSVPLLALAASADIIRGKVTDADDATPIANVRVGVAANIYTMTAADGTYELNTTVTSIDALHAAAPRLSWESESQSFTWSDYYGPASVEIRNARGMRMGEALSLNATQHRFQVPEFSQGLYFVRVTLGANEFLQKIVKLNGLHGYAYQGSAEAAKTRAGANPVLAKEANVTAVNSVAYENSDYTPVTKSVDGSQDNVNVTLKRLPVATLDNGILIVKFDRATEKVTVTYKDGNKLFIEDGTLNKTGGNAKVIARTDKTFGAGQAIEISYAGGNKNRIMLYPNLPFALFQTCVNNATAGPLLQRKVPTLSAYSSVVGSTSKALGTQGLTGPDQQSYTYIAVADPTSRSGVVGGWITHDRGNGVVFSSSAAPRVKLDATIEYGTLNIRPNTLEEMEVFAVGYFADARLGMESWADNVAKYYAIKLHPQPNGFVTWYSDKCGRGGDETCVAQLADWVAKSGLKNFGFNFIQIDDYWQAGIKGDGPAKNFNTIDPTGPYPSGMKPIADKIRAAGLTAGLWFMPFSGNLRDPFFTPHPDWFVKGKDGTPPENAWSIHPLDMTSAGAAANLTGFTARMSKEWGFKYFKMDGIYHGMAGEHLYTQNNYKDDMEDAAANRPVTYSDPYVTPIEAMRKGLKMIRQAAGDDVFFLGCSLIMNLRAFSGVVGLVDAMRVGPDNNPAWDRVQRGPEYGTKFFHFNNRLWYNDPDPVYLRTSVGLPATQAICSWAGITGQYTVHSDWLPDVTPQALDAFKRVIPSHGNKNVRPIDIFDNAMSNFWLLTDTTQSVRRDVLFAINWDGTNAMLKSVTMAKAGLSATDAYVGFDFWANKFVAPFTGTRNFALAAATCQVLALRKAVDYPILISTSRHVTQGIIDVTGENWDAASKTLSATSQVVAADDYELRIVTAKAGGNWVAASASVSAEDKAAGVTIDAPSLDGANVRVKIHSAANRAVKWSVLFN